MRTQIPTEWGLALEEAKEHVGEAREMYVKVTGLFNSSIAQYLARALDLSLSTGGSSAEANRRMIVHALADPLASQPIKAAIVAAWRRYDGQGLRETFNNPGGAPGGAAVVEGRPLMRGTIRAIVRDRGFGFITPEDRKAEGSSIARSWRMARTSATSRKAMP